MLVWLLAEMNGTSSDGLRRLSCKYTKNARTQRPQCVGLSTGHRRHIPSQCQAHMQRYSFRSRNHDAQRYGRHSHYAVAGKKICGKQNTDKKRKEKQPEQHTSMHWEKSEQTVALKSSPSLRWCSSGHSPPLSPKTLKHVSDEIHKHKQKRIEKMKEKRKAIWWASSKTRLKFREARKHAASMRPSTSAGSSASVAGA